MSFEVQTWSIHAGLKPISPAMLTACCLVSPAKMSTGSFKMAVGFSWATSSMLIPPWELPTITGPCGSKHAQISKLVIYLMISLNVRWAGTKLEFWNCLILPVKSTGCVVYPRLERLSIDVCMHVCVTRAIP